MSEINLTYLCSRFKVSWKKESQWTRTPVHITAESVCSVLFPSLGVRRSSQSVDELHPSTVPSTFSSTPPHLPLHRFLLTAANSHTILYGPPQHRWATPTEPHLVIISSSSSPSSSCSSSTFASSFCLFWYRVLAQADFEFPTLLPPPPECWGYMFSSQWFCFVFFPDCRSRVGKLLVEGLRLKIFRWKWGPNTQIGRNVNVFMC